MTSFCETCRDMTEVTIKEQKKSKIIKGKNVTYNAKVAYCNKCNNEVFVSNIRDYNIEKLDFAYRKLQKLITIPEIQSILERYNIGKRPLSLLLNWGEGTLTRYLNGDIPTKQYSDTLYKLKDYKVMEELLESGKDRITQRAYEVSKAAISGYKKELVNGGDKIDNIVRYIILLCVEITPLALQKLLYYAQGFYMAFNGTFLFDEDCEAWVHGPVYRNIYKEYKCFGFDPIDDDIESQNYRLNQIEAEVLERICLYFGCYSGKVLEKMTHVESPWKNARKGLDENEGSDRVITKEAILEYFDNIREKYNMLNVSDIKDYSDDLFNKIYN